ncbi:MAG: MBOAT family O-acyltransferase [Oscillospiraceae bacterium]
MVFSSLTFIYIFLPLCFILYYSVKSIDLKNIVLLSMSLLFYAWGEPKWIIVLIISTFVEYCGGLLIDKYQGTWKAKVALGVSVTIALSFLGLFKYYDFFATTTNNLFGSDITLLGLGLPIGISFYTFQTITYSVDVFRGRAKVQKSFSDLLLYVSMFPQLIAGPIVRYVDIDEQIRNRSVDVKNAAYGVTRFLIGLAKKALLANFAGQIVKDYLVGDLNKISVVGAWIGIISYTLQIYFDFSGYSDMAIGLGHMFGFKYVENFNYPYIAKSVSDFWKRWHISLTTFFREYVYIPLGGNRKNHVLNLLIVWFLTGMWHGASWNFIIWGLYYFVFIVIERLFLGNILEKIPKFFSHLYTLLVVMIGWVFFYFDDISKLNQMLSIMFGFGGVSFSHITDSTYIINRLLFFIIAIIACTPVSERVKNVIQKLSNRNLFCQIIADIIVIAFNILLLVICTAALVGTSYNPFLYFRF